MGLQERIAARAAKRAAVDEAAKKAAEDAASKKAIVEEAVKRSAEEAAARKAAKAEARKHKALKPPKVEKPKNVVEKVAGEPPDQTAAAVAQTDPELFRDAAARATAAAEINAARKQWAEGPAKVLSR